MYGPIRSIGSRLFAGLASALLVVAMAGCSGPSTDGLEDTGDSSEGGERDTGVDDKEDTFSEIEDTGTDTASSDTGPGFDVPEWDTSTPDSSGLPPLSLTSVSPKRGPVDGGTKFVLHGEGFTSETVVYFGSRKAQADLVDGNIVGQTPSAPGPGKVAVKAVDPETGKDSLSKAFTYIEKLEINSVTPARIPTEGGVQVTIGGAGFGPKTRVSFDGDTALQHTLVNDKTVRVTAPPNPAGSADVRVTSRDGSVVSRDAVEYYEPLSVDSVRPATGSTSGGDQVQIHGTGFESGMSVSFGGASGTVKSVLSDGTRATVTTPSHGSGLVDVVVQTPGGNGARAKDAFYYRSSSSEFALAAVRPGHAQESGNVDVTLIGSGLDRSGLTAKFGGKNATVGSTGPGHAVVTVPPHSPAKVDVSISDGSGSSDTLTKGFEYVPNLDITGVQPSKGSASGGTSVTITGKGFTSDVKNVEFGGQPATFTRQSKTKITAKAPNHAPGVVDVVVERSLAETRAERAFTFTEKLQIFGFNPVRGSVAGNTYVEIRGRGFINNSMDVAFGSNAATSIRVVDSQTLAVRTPKHAPGSVDVSVTRSGTTVKGPQQYTYFNPGSDGGGVWGGPINGAVNVTVFSVAGSPIHGAFVMLSTNPKTDYTGQTDQNGMVTLSGPEVQGTQTITATAPGYTSTTVQNVNAENVTIFLTPLATGGSPPGGPPTATFKGKLTGLDKIASPNPNEFILGVVLPTKESPWDRNPSVDDGNFRRTNGQFEVTTRVGDLALVAFGGVLNTDTGILTPLRMGVKRYLSPAGGKTYKRDIDLDIPLNQTLRFKLKNPPHSANGPNHNHVTPYFDFGFEGVFGQEQIPYGEDSAIMLKIYAEGKNAIVKNTHQPALTGKLSDVEYRAIGGSYRSPANSPQYGPPQSVAIKRNITKTNQLITLPELTGVPLIQTPGAGQKVKNNLISWQLNSSKQPDFYLVQILTGMGAPLWHAFAPPGASSVRLPDFPDFSHLPKSKRPVPYPGGQFQLVVLGARIPGVSYGNFSYSDLGFGNFQTFAIDAQQIKF